jgi:hypothetical protein
VEVPLDDFHRCKVVRVVGESKDRSVRGRFGRGDTNNSLESRFKDRFRVQMSPGELKHHSSLKMKIIIARAEAVKAEKLGERNGVTT